MTGWDVLSDTIKYFSPVAAAIVLFAAAVIFIVGFSRRGMNFIRCGFGQTMLDNSLEKRFDDLSEKLGSLDSKIVMIETNHFGHLKNFLTELTSILLDKGVINNENKARLDNQLSGM
jgi:hypothetical protein